MSHAWMPLAIDDYLADTRHLTTLEHGAYLLLIMRYWQKGGLPGDDHMIQRIAGMNDAQWGESRSILAAFFDEGWRHPRIDAELVKAAEIIEKRRNAANRMHASRGANASAEQVHSKCCDMRVPPKPGTTYPDADASGMVDAPLGDDWPADYRDRFWSAYPHKIGKSDAMSKLDRVRKSRRVTFAKIMSGLDFYKSSKPPDRPWCNPSTWLNQGRWDDEPAPHEERRSAAGNRGSAGTEQAISALADAVHRRSGGGLAPDDPGALRPDGPPAPAHGRDAFALEPPPRAGFGR